MKGAKSISIKTDGGADSVAIEQTGDAPINRSESYSNERRVIEIFGGDLVRCNPK